MGIILHFDGLIPSVKSVRNEYFPTKLNPSKNMSEIATFFTEFYPWELFRQKYIFFKKKLRIIKAPSFAEKEGKKRRREK